MSILDCDFLYEIAEKLLCTQDNCRVNLLKATRFMFVNKDCKNAFLAQFSKMKVVEIYFRPEGMEMNFYKNKDVSLSVFDTEFKGPYVADVAFVNFLMQSNRFHPRTIQINGAFSNRDDSNGTTTECLASIFNFKYFPKLDFIQINQQDERVDWSMLSQILNLNSEQYEVLLNIGNEDLNNGLLSCGFESKVVGVVAEATKRILLRYRFWDVWSVPFDFSLWKTQTWRHLLVFLVERCPNVECIDIAINSIAIGDSQTNEFMEMMEWIIGWFVQEVLPILNEKCDLKLHLQFCISNAVYALLLTETKTSLVSTIFSELQFDTFFNIVTPLILWVTIRILPKMRRKCTVEMWLHLTFAGSRGKELLMRRIDLFAKLTGLEIVDGIEFITNSSFSYTHCVKTATKCGALEILWYI